MMKRALGALLVVLVFAVTASANPYLPKSGEPTAILRIATSAVTGGFVHLYSGLDYGIFEKYGLKYEHIQIRGSAPTPSPRWPAIRSSSPMGQPTAVFPGWRPESKPNSSLLL
ncbi:MAG: hypothetical protein WCH75_24520 [Candidatus Binatia bacterium]